jgi:hypothetical protein
MSGTNVSYSDQQLVDDSESLWRRIHFSWIKKKTNRIYSPSSAAFKGIDISVDIASKTTPQKSIRDSAALAGFLASVPKRLGHQVVEAPLPDNLAHALIKGKITRAKARKIADSSKCIIEPKPPF